MAPSKAQNSSPMLWPPPPPEGPVLYFSFKGTVYAIFPDLTNTPRNVGLAPYKNCSWIRQWLLRNPAPHSGSGPPTRKSLETLMQAMIQGERGMGRDDAPLD